MAEDESKSEGSHERRVQLSGLSVHAQEFVPQQNQTGSFVLYDPLLNTSQWFDYLFDDPEDLPNVLINLDEILTKYLDVRQSLETIIDNILRKCLGRNNVQYIAAQCCSQLCQNPTFKDVFIKRCNVMHKEFLSSQNFTEELANFALLISELSLTVKTTKGHLYDILLEAVIELLSKLLDFSNDVSIRCIQKILKISGASLDKLVAESFSKFFERMKEKTVSECISKQSRSVLLDLVIFRSSGWQLSDNLPSSSDSLDNPGKFDTNLNGEEHGYICYGATIFKDDREHFLVPNEDAEPEIYEEYEKFVAENEIGMDASMQSDYEKFLEDLERKFP